MHGRRYHWCWVDLVRLNNGRLCFGDTAKELFRLFFFYSWEAMRKNLTTGQRQRRFCVGQKVKSDRKLCRDCLNLKHDDNNNVVDYEQEKKEKNHPFKIALNNGGFLYAQKNSTENKKKIRVQMFFFHFSAAFVLFAHLFVMYTFLDEYSLPINPTRNTSNTNANAYFHPKFFFLESESEWLVCNANDFILLLFFPIVSRECKRERENLECMEK